MLPFTLSHMERRGCFSLAIALAAVLERASEQVLPSVYAYVAKSFSSFPSRLGYLTLARALVQAVVSPLGGIASSISRTYCRRY